MKKGGRRAKRVQIRRNSKLPFEEKRRRIGNLIDDFLNGLKKIKNEEEEFIDSKLDEFEMLRMELRFLKTFVLFGNSTLDDFYDRMWFLNKDKFNSLTRSLFYEDELILAKYDMEGLAPLLLEEIKSYLSLKNDYVATTTEEKMLEYMDSIFKHLYDLPMYCSDLLLPLMSEYKILRQVCRHLRDFYGLECIMANKTRTEYLYPRYQTIVDRVTQFCFDLWTGKRKQKIGDSNYFYKYDVSQCSSKITSLLIDIIPLELEVLYICTSEIKKQPRSTELKGWVQQILKASPKILQNYLILIQGHMEGALAVNYAPTQSINVMMEFLLIFLTDIPKRFIHPDKLNNMLAHVGLITRKISILVSKLLEESSGININEEDFSSPDLWHEIERMKGDIRQIFQKAPESSQLCFPMDDGFLFLNLLLRHLNDLLISNVYSVALIKKEIMMVIESHEFLRSSFGKVRQTLDDTSGVVKDCWVRSLEVAYEAEHVINCILVRDNALKHLIFSLPSVIDKIKLIVAEVTSLQLEDKNGDDPLDAKSSDEPIEFVDVTVGHEEEEARIIEQLLDEHESELDVISIVGMPGLGKTTLANKVFQNKLVASHFNVCAWCTVSQKYNKSKVLQHIRQQVTRSEEKESEEDLAEKLRRALLDIRYLIVLDDVWDIATAEMLIACFPKVKRGNRIILTSRSSKVGLQVKCRSDPVHLQLLTPEKSWELFEKRVFGEGSCPAELSEVGHQIVEKCQRLPLTLVLIAGVIVRAKKKKKEKDLWLKIQHSLDSFISADKNLQMMKVMQLSYDHLPYHLKPLLLYFARYQKSKRTPVSKLMQLWMDEGLVDRDIPSKSSQSDLDTLISSSLIMVDHIPCESNQPFSVMIKVCYVHDVVHDFCSVKAKKEKFLKLINSGAPFHGSDFLHRRLTIHTDEGQLHKRCVLFNSHKSSAGSKHLIALKVSGSLDNSSYICHTRHLRLLRVLELGNTVLGESLAEEIGSLFHLRFLRIQAYINAIPLSWVNLQNLETLLIEPGYHIMVLLPRILKLSKLKHVSIDLCSFFEVDNEWDIIMDQPSRILEAENSKLEDLTTLSKVLISYSEGTNDALEKFPNLQHLNCIIKEPIDPPTHGDWFPKIDVLNKLESLIASYQKAWAEYCYEYDPELIDKIPPPNEYHFPTSLKELRLYGFPMRCALFSAMAALPELEILEIIDCDFVEDKWDASEDIYQSLKTLRLVSAEFSEWEVDRESFPNLEKLILEHCEELAEIPCAFGDIQSLKSIRVVQIKREVGDSAMKIKKDVEAYTGEDKLDVHVSYAYDDSSEEEEGEEEEEDEGEEEEEEEASTFSHLHPYV
ncbi:putative late blight resistance protein homolog R1B-16 isoform X2 [Solanum dulcamara]|uniref:putative late blight resistance protein homolog R1B-16 isoform X2 n=1 Tax=Solanum dulcamara TaxID=45834 RepID=UPI0024862EEC|nr:putative late blight resistance protein homolog R1B-16 isoform X2 [Solanum dulcamara]